MCNKVAYALIVVSYLRMLYLEEDDEEAETS
jgi:hypothetical protein